MLSFKKQKVENISEFLPFIQHIDYKLGSYSMGWKILWTRKFNFFYTVANNCYIQYVEMNKQPYFYYPISLSNNENEEKESLKLIGGYCTQNKLKLSFIDIPKHKLINILSIYYYHNTIHQDRKWMNYSYNAKEFLELTGKKYSKQRNRIRAFLKQNIKYEFLKIDRNNIEETKKFIDNWWRKYPKEKNSDFSDYAAKFESSILDYYFEFNLIGAIMKINDEIVAACIGEKCGNTLYNHVEKINHKIIGLDSFFVNLFAKTFVTNDIKFINREDDVGDKGLRRSKLQYEPEELVCGYTINVHNEFFYVTKAKTIKINQEIKLADITSKDKNYFELCSDDDLNKYYGYDYHKYFDEKIYKKPIDLEWFLQSRKKDLLHKNEISWGIFVNNELVGEVNLFDINYNHEAWLGFRTLKRFQNKGYTSQCAKVIIDYALYTLGLNKVLSKCYKQNIPSKNMLLKIGMQSRGEDENFYYFDVSSK